MKKRISKNPSDFFWLMLFFSIILTILSGVTSCFLAYASGRECDLVTPDFGIKKCVNVGDLPALQQHSLACNQINNTYAPFCNHCFF
ncbi:MAG: hypothetical protein C5B45_04510 [Chlamydiae bacterium]|nr:MAG: hypothetical protein C5B45_04510 [Chlamydiota bacterium]